MKRILSAALALSLLGGTAAMAQPYGDHRNDNNRHDQRVDNRHDNRQAHRWTRGQRLPNTYYTRSHYVDYRKHHLRQPPRGYQWVQVDNNYAMVALASGLISQIIAAR